MQDFYHCGPSNTVWNIYKLGIRFHLLDRKMFWMVLIKRAGSLVFPAFLIYRKFLKSSEIVYNELEIKNDMTKERMVDSP